MTAMDIIQWNLMVVICTTIYWRASRKDRHFNWNRLVLLTIPLLSSLPLFFPIGVTIPVFSITLPEQGISVVKSLSTTKAEASMWSLKNIWLAGVLLMLIRSVWRAIRVKHLLLKMQGIQGATFLHKVYLGPSLNETQREMVLAHERVHLEQGHSLDLVYFEILKVLFWFNPAFYFLQKLAKEQHEYLADRAVYVRDKSYPEFLVAQRLGVDRSILMNEFNNVNLKNRIEMMIQEKGSKPHRKWYLGMMGIATALVMMSMTTLPVDRILDTEHVDKRKVYEQVDEMPRFPGCEEGKMDKDARKKCAFGKLIDYMSAEVKYPKQAEKDGVEGKVMVRFTVAAGGEIKDALVEQSAEASLDREALRVVSAMPNWIPGVHKGKAVDVSVVLPVQFALTSLKKSE